MFTVNKINNQRIDIALSGKLGADDMKVGLDQFIKLSER